MDQTDNRIDQRFSDVASRHHRDVPGHLWQDLEEKLDRSAKIRKWRIYSGVAASFLMIAVFSFILGLPDQDSVTITDLTSEPQKTYFRDYRDFIRSDRYARLVEDYQAVR